MKQTAVKILIEHLIKMYYLDEETLYEFEQANQMFEQQIIDAANWDSKSISENGIRKGEQYYNETFKK